MIYAAVIALLGYACRLLSLSGALAAAIVGGLIWEAGRLAWAIPLLVFFSTSSLLTLVGKRKKESVGLESRPRGAAQVFAKGGPAAVCAAIYIFDGGTAWAAAALASLACANADTWATEIGSLVGKRFFRISNLKPAQRGRSGAVSMPGLMASFLGAAVVAVFAPMMGLQNVIGVTFIGFCGALLDSFIGDLAQNDRWLTNNAVNFISVAVAAVAGYWLAA